MVMVSANGNGGEWALAVIAQKKINNEVKKNGRVFIAFFLILNLIDDDTNNRHLQNRIYATICQSIESSSNFGLI